MLNPPAAGLPKGPEDLSPYVRCITRGLPGMMMPSVYNNGLQIFQGPGYVTIQKEMVHETRVIPTRPRPAGRTRSHDMAGRFAGPMGR